jgi:ProP effector
MEDTQKFSNTKEVLAFLAETFPKCFTLENEAKPLKIGIFHDLANRLEGDERVSKRLLRMALRHYTSGWKYLASVKVGAHRVDLDGETGDAVEEEHAEHAQLQLKESKAKAAEKRQQLKQDAAQKRSFKNRAANPGAKKAKKPNTHKSENKPTKPNVPRKVVKELLESDVVVGKEVSVKVGKTPMPATITDIGKDGIQVQLNSGMSVKVQREQLRLVN